MLKNSIVVITTPTMSSENQHLPHVLPPNITVNYNSSQKCEVSELRFELLTPNLTMPLTMLVLQNLFIFPPTSHSSPSPALSAENLLASYFIEKIKTIPRKFPFLFSFSSHITQMLSATISSSSVSHEEVTFLLSKARTSTYTNSSHLLQEIIPSTIPLPHFSSISPCLLAASILPINMSMSPAS